MVLDRNTRKKFKTIDNDLSTDKILSLEGKLKDTENAKIYLQNNNNKLKTELDVLKNEIEVQKKAMLKLEQQMKQVSEENKDLCNKQNLMNSNILDIQNLELDVEQRGTLKLYIRGDFFHKIKYDFDNVLINNKDMGYVAIFRKLKLNSTIEQIAFKKHITEMIRKELSQKRYECKISLKPKIQYLFKKLEGKTFDPYWVFLFRLTDETRLRASERYREIEFFFLFYANDVMASVNEQWNSFPLTVRQSRIFKKDITYNDEMFGFFLLLHLAAEIGLNIEPPFFENPDFQDLDYPTDEKDRVQFELVIKALKHSHGYFKKNEKVTNGGKNTLPRCDNKDFMENWASPIQAAFCKVKKLKLGRAAERRLTQELIETYKPIDFSPISSIKTNHALLKRKSPASVFNEGIDFANDFNDDDDDQEL